jgi:hypothetical protein
MGQKILRTALAVFVLAAAISGATAAGAAGRYKKDGKRCIWDEKDSGPNQCEPITAGRFKKDGDKCEWAPGDNGPDQCKPVKGRFKKDGNKCEWNATDSGPNQCDPRDSR